MATTKQINTDDRNRRAQTLVVADKTVSTGKKRLGIILQYYESRDDLPPLLEALAEDWHIVLFATAKDLQKVETIYETRPIKPLPRTFKNRAVRALYESVGNIPSDKANFRSWRLWRIAQEPRWYNVVRLRFLLALRVVFGGLISFDEYLGRLTLNRETVIDDIDVFFAMTDVYDVNLMAHIIESNKPMVTYVYSWDHAAKFQKFSRHVTRYLTWHDGIKDDLVELHGLEATKIASVGSTQLTLIDEFLRAEPNQVFADQRNSYVYYACSMGYPESVEQEIRVVLFLAKTLALIAPEVRLLVRLHPFNTSLQAYIEALAGLPNLDLDNTANVDGRLTILKDSTEEKYRKIRDSLALVHMGSTIGLEAAYLPSPVLLLALEDFDYGRPLSSNQHVRHIFAQRHLQKYMLNSDEPNVIRREASLEILLREVLAAPENFLAYNRELSERIELKSMIEIAAEIGCHARKCLINGSSNYDCSTIAATTARIVGPE